MKRDRVSIADRILAGLAKMHVRGQMRRFFRAAERASKVQQEGLRRLLRRRAGSAFGVEHGFSDICNVRDFQSRVPVRTYEEFAPYVDRVRRGETTALLAPDEPILMFATTSGSTDRPKHVPVTPSFIADYRRGWNIFGLKALLDHPDCFLRGIVQVVSRMDESRTELGVPCGSISGLLAATQKRLVRKYYVVPSQTALIADPTARYYAVMRFAVPKDVSWIVTASPATPLKLAKTAAEHADRLIRDLRDGTLSPPGERLPAHVLALLSERLKPDVEAARRLEDILTREGVLRPTHYWRLGFLANWTGGTLGHHLREFPTWFGATPVRDIGLLATEGRVTFGIADGTSSGVLDVEGGFFEFLPPEESAGGGGHALTCEALEVGAEYRVILTNASGLVRYDIGDRVRVTGYVGTAPLLEFLHRGANVASVTGEKLTEWQVVQAYARVRGSRGDASEIFVLSPQWGDPPWYRLHVEPGCDEIPAARLAAAVDEQLSALNIEYAQKRRSGRLGAVEVNVVPTGFLTSLDRERQAVRGGAHEQFKHQYLQASPGLDSGIPVASGAPGSPSGAARSPEYAPSGAQGPRCVQSRND
ncbi:MAG: hypothetical protein BroJett003_01140 [Planctomycetota bacterium]|nr:MAG: hypothetical protein BroJett003_01140 [Planctomycetota bacterium]